MKISEANRVAVQIWLVQTLLTYYWPRKSQALKLLAGYQYMRTTGENLFKR